MKTLAGFILIALFSVLYLYLYQSGSIGIFFNQDTINTLVNDVGAWGPVLIITLMTGAIVMSPIPSAPIALASGIAYGHVWGTIYIIIGAEAGALIAFTMARLLGYDAMRKRFGDHLKLPWLQSQTNLMLIVGISRLIPFISFDIVSYAAGLTPLSYIKFAFATMLGIIPASFLLAHVGNELVFSSDLPGMMVTFLLLGGITVIPLIISLVVRKKY